MPGPGPRDHAGGPECDDVDRALLAAGRGDQDAFARFYDATSAHVFSLALEMAHGRQACEDLALESYVEAWRAAPTFDRAHCSAKTWLTMHVLRQTTVRSARNPARTARDEIPG